MGWWGKLLGGALGYALGGPLGALIGAALGHSFDSGARKLDEAFSARERTQTAFYTATFSVMGHLAKADGRVTMDELRLAIAVMDQMYLSSELRRVAQRLFNEGKAAGFPLDEVLDQLRQECHQSRSLIRMFIEIQLQAAYADGSVHPHEQRLLLHICNRLGISRQEFERLEAMIQAELRFRASNHWQAPGYADTSLEDAYAILNISSSASDAEVKRAYRRLMSQHHPDKLVAKGLPDEMMKLATEKTQEIKTAYERIKESRDLR